MQSQADFMLQLVSVINAILEDALSSMSRLTQIHLCEGSLILEHVTMTCDGGSLRIPGSGIGGKHRLPL